MHETDSSAFALTHTAEAVITGLQQLDRADDQWKTSSSVGNSAHAGQPETTACDGSVNSNKLRSLNTPIRTPTRPVAGGPLVFANKTTKDVQWCWRSE
jgi:hypothetical protein